VLDGYLVALRRHSGTAHGEERRVAYVALTRAKRYSALAVPATCPDDRIAELKRRGIVLMP
jgi:superfamily I DNA/RNA helicase